MIGFYITKPKTPPYLDIKIDETKKLRVPVISHDTKTRALTFPFAEKDGEYKIHHMGLPQGEQESFSDGVECISQYCRQLYSRVQHEIPEDVLQKVLKFHVLMSTRRLDTIVDAEPDACVALAIFAKVAAFKNGNPEPVDTSIRASLNEKWKKLYLPRYDYTNISVPNIAILSLYYLPDPNPNPNSDPYKIPEGFVWEYAQGERLSVPDKVAVVRACSYLHSGNTGDLYKLPSALADQFQGKTLVIGCGNGGDFEVWESGELAYTRIYPTESILVTSTLPALLEKQEVWGAIWSNKHEYFLDDVHNRIQADDSGTPPVYHLEKALFE